MYNLFNNKKKLTHLIFDLKQSRKSKGKVKIPILLFLKIVYK